MQPSNNVHPRFTQHGALMKKLIRLLVTVTTFTFALLSLSAYAQWPQRPIRIVAAAPAGSSVDIVARLLADGLKEKLGQAVIVDNKPAAGGTVGATEVAKAAPDGYTLFLGFNGPLANAPALYAKLAYDPLRDFTPIVLTTSQPNVLAVNANVAANNLKEFIALANAQPGKLNYASVGNGSASHLSMELLKREAKVDLTHIPFNGGPPATQALVAGDVQAIFTAPSNVMGQIKAGKLKALAVTSLKPFSLMPDVPTIAASGIHGLREFEAISWNALVAPRDTPVAVITRLNKEVNTVLASAEVKRKLADAGIEAVGGTPEALAQWMALEAKKWEEVIRTTGARVD
jgi:tripartite-type tricarboxylate transporter receptor subunit TctC